MSFLFIKNIIAIGDPCLFGRIIQLMDVLYHASTNSELTVLEPQRTLSKDKYIGDFVFATKDKLLAVMYLIPKGYGSIMDTKSKPPKILICANESEIKSK